MRPLFLILPVVALAACSPPPVGFDKHPVGGTTAARDARDAAAAKAARSSLTPAPAYSFTSREMRRNDAPLPQSEAAMRAMAERKTRKGTALSAGGQAFTVSQVTYDGQYFLVAHGGSGGGVDQSEALKSMADTVTPCPPSGPAWRAQGSYAIALSCS